MSKETNNSKFQKFYLRTNFQYSKNPFSLHISSSRNFILLDYWNKFYVLQLRFNKNLYHVLLSWVGTLIILNQYILYLSLCLHLNNSSLRVLSSCLWPLRLIIHIFSSIHMLYLQLKLFVIEDHLTNFPFLWGVSPWSLTFQNHLEELFLKPSIWEGMAVIIQSLFPMPRWNTNLYSIPIIIIFHEGNEPLVYDFLRVTSSA